MSTSGSLRRSEESRGSRGDGVALPGLALTLVGVDLGGLLGGRDSLVQGLALFDP